jgi:hypothetical protein
MTLTHELLSQLNLESRGQFLVHYTPRPGPDGDDGQPCHWAVWSLDAYGDLEAMVACGDCLSEVIADAVAEFRRLS